MSREMFPRRPRRRVIFALASSPPLLRGGFGFWFCSGSLSHELGSSREAARLLIFPHPRSFIFLFVTTPSGCETDKRSGCQVPTMVLSETRGLWLSWVVRGGIERSEERRVGEECRSR